MSIAEHIEAAPAHYGAVLVSVDGHDVIDCEVCGFRHIDPLFSDEELKKFYDGEFYQNERPDYFTRAEADKDWWMLRYGHYFELLEAHAPGRRLLDIGSGPGYFLEAGQQRGWDVLGFEPSRIAAEYTATRGIAVVNDFFKPGQALSRGPFDVVSLNLVLEHLRDPIGLIEDAKRMLAPGGILFVTSPNDFNPLQMLLWQKMNMKPWWVVPRHHLNYFDASSISRLFASRGLEPLHLETSYPLETYILAGRNYVGDDMVGRACHAERKVFETALFRHDPARLRALAAGWVAQGIGREFVILGRKVRP
jgi:SAM-dependent methyltransferase